MAEVTPTIKERGTSVFPVAIKQIQFKNTLRILKCGPQRIKEYRKRIGPRVLFSKDTQQADSGVP